MVYNMGVVVNSADQIALQWTINTNGKTVRIDGTGRYYVFVPRSQVVMCWINREDVPRLLSHREKTCNCGGGTFKNAFVPASLINVNIWSFGVREGSLQSDYREVDDLNFNGG